MKNCTYIPMYISAYYVHYNYKINEINIKWDIIKVNNIL